jgi:hypothetical protein
VVDNRVQNKAIRRTHYPTIITAHEGILRYTRLHTGISFATEGFTEDTREHHRTSQHDVVIQSGTSVIFQHNPVDQTQRHIVCIVSRLLTDVERRYSQVEKEALGVVRLCERAINLIDHDRFRIVVDNRAVMLMKESPKSKPQAKIERWALSYFWLELCLDKDDYYRV